MKERGVKVFSATTKYHHNFTAFIERFNKTFAEQLFKDQDAQELQNPTEDSKIWVKYLQKAVTRLNSEKTRMLGMTPAKAVKLGNVELKVEFYPKEEVVREGGWYRYLYKPGELEDDNRRRATDMIWSLDTFRIDRTVDREGHHVLYYLDADGPQREFVREELQEVPEDVKLPPDWVKKW